MVEPYLHTYLCLRGVVFKLLSTGTNLHFLYPTVRDPFSEAYSCSLCQEIIHVL
jgi:hypothetical protein